MGKCELLLPKSKNQVMSSITKQELTTMQLKQYELPGENIGRDLKTVKLDLASLRWRLG